MLFRSQMAAMGAGTVSLKEGFGNITSAMLDSFVPIPFSKIPIAEDWTTTLMWAIDSGMPTVIRPAVEYAMNKNGIGQDINSASMRRMADAFTGGDRIPELYRDLSEMIFDISDGETSITPNTLYFFANSYLDGVSRVSQLMYNSGTKAERDFNPRTDLPTLSSFFGAKSNVDAREFGRMEKKLEEIDKNLATFDKGVANEEVGYRYEDKHPMYREFVELYKTTRTNLTFYAKKPMRFVKIGLSTSVTAKRRCAKTSSCRTASSAR